MLEAHLPETLQIKLSSSLEPALVLGLNLPGSLGGKVPQLCWLAGIHKLPPMSKNR